MTNELCWKVEANNKMYDCSVGQSGRYFLARYRPADGGRPDFMTGRPRREWVTVKARFTSKIMAALQVEATVREHERKK